LKTCVWAALLLGIQSLLGQCLGLLERSEFVSDRYTDAVLFQQHLVLANDFGLVVRDGGVDSFPIGMVTGVPGGVQSLAAIGENLFAFVPGVGVYRYRWQASEASLNLLSFSPFPGASAFAIGQQGLYIFSDHKLSLYSLENPDLLLASSGLLEGVVRRILPAMGGPATGGPATGGPATGGPASGGVLLLRDDGSLLALAHTPEGFAPARPVNAANEDHFYDVLPFQDGFLLDAPAGLLLLGNPFAADSPDARLLVPNRGVQVVLGMACGNSRVFLRFSGRIQAYRMESGQWIEEASGNFPLPEIRFPTMVVAGEDLYLLNRIPQQRDWSLAHLEVRGGQVEMAQQLPSADDRVNGAARIGDVLFLALDRGIKYGPMLDSQVEFSSFETLDLGRPVLGLVADESHLYAFLGQTVDHPSLLQVYRMQDSRLVPHFSQVLKGSISQWKFQHGWVGFSQFFRDAEQDHYLANALSFADGGLQPEQYQLEIKLPIGSDNPLQALNLARGGFLFHDGQALQLAPFGQPPRKLSHNLEFLPLRGLALSDEALLLETTVATHLFRLSGQTLQPMAEFPRWHDLQVTANGLVLARSELYELGGILWILQPRGDQLLPSLRLDASFAPSFVDQLGNVVVSSSAASVDLFRTECPEYSFSYLFPFKESQFLEYNTHAQAGDLVRFSIFNSANRLIGTQLLDVYTLHHVQGIRMRDSFLDFNALETPFRFTIQSSYPLQPVLSQQASHEPPGFALRVPTLKSGRWFCPHVAELDAGWTTRVHFSSHSAQSSLHVEFLDEQNQVLALPLTTGYSYEQDLRQLFGRQVPYFQMQPEALGDSVAGYVVYSRQNAQGQAGTNLFQEPGEFFLLPHLSGDPSWWTGLVLTNPNGHSVRVRLLGYDQGGSISVDRNFDLAAGERFTALLEEELHIFTQGLDVQWLTLVSEAAIFATGLIGHYQDASLASFELTTENHNHLIFSGVQQSAQRWVQLVVVNREARSVPLTFTAYDTSGKLLAETELIFSRRQKQLIAPATLFGTDPELLSKLSTIEVESVADLTGLLLRGSLTSPQIDAISIVD
jgi:hypothetical protein